MAEQNTTTATERQSRRNVKIGQVVSTKMDKTIVVRVDSQKPHPLYRRVMKRSKKFYAHDAENTCRVGDWVKIEECRPLSRLKRWQLKDIIQRSALAAVALPEGTEPLNEVTT